MNRKKSSKVSFSPVALFRYQVVSLVLSWMLSGWPRSEAVWRAAEMTHPCFDGRTRKVSPRTIYRWLSDYKAKGIAGLEPTARLKNQGSEVLSEEFLAFLIRQKDDDPKTSLPELIRRARELGIVDANECVNRTTVWRTCKRLGVSVQRRRKQPERDTRRFAYPHRMDMVLCDGKHFRAGVTRAKRVALFFLDDCSRNGLHVVVGTSESAKLFLRGLYECIRQAGLMTAMYLDHGPGFDAATPLKCLRTWAHGSSSASGRIHRATAR